MSNNFGQSLDGVKISV